MRRLWVQQTLTFSVVVIIIMSIAAIWINQSTVTEYRKFITLRELRTTGKVLDELSDYYNQRGNWEGVDSLLADGLFFTEDSGILLGASMAESERVTGLYKGASVLLADVDGRVVFDTNNETTGELLSQRERDNALSLGTAEYQSPTGYLLIYFTVTKSLDEGDQKFLNSVENILLVNTALAVVMIVGIGALLSQRLNTPLQRLVVAAETVAAGDLEQQVEVDGSVEIARVGQAFNEMMAALKEAEILRQNMVADVAHELRTPLSVLQGNLWAILNDAYPLEKVEIARLYDETRLLSRLVEDLRDLALADAGQLDLNVQLTDVSPSIRHTVDNFALAAEVQEVNLAAHIPDEIPQVQVDADRIAQVLRNLLVNALRHTPPGGTVTVSVFVADDAVDISVSDTGEGIASEHIIHVFERFWRADPGRFSSDGDVQFGTGSGLGLAVAQSLMEAQGGRIWVESTLGEGSTFHITLPVVSDTGIN